MPAINDAAVLCLISDKMCIRDRFQTVRADIPVSYTHLDVYKRQD
ncbi:hypothetical protein [Erwinia amylovora]